MSKPALTSIYQIFTVFLLLLSVAVSSIAADDMNASDTLELINGDKVEGTVLNDTFTLTTPYTVITLDKDKISEISINSESGKNDIIQLNAGGSLEGTLEELEFSLKLPSGKTISFEKEKCKKIILKGKNG